MTDTLLHQGRFLSLVDRDGWEFCARTHGPDVVALIAVTELGELLLTEQFRPPLGRPVLELPAGLVGDEDGQENEGIEAAGQRELLEETGYRATTLTAVLSGPASAGLSNETIHFLRAHGLERVDEGGGVGSEMIIVHRVRVEAVDRFVEDCADRGVACDPKVHAALWLLLRERYAEADQ